MHNHRMETLESDFLIRNDVTAICSHLLQMWRLIKQWEVISTYNPDLAPYNVLKCVCLHMRI